MSFENIYQPPVGESKNYEAMDFSELESDPVAGPVLQEQALNFLKNEDAEYFNSEFNGELDAEGYLLKKGGSPSNTKPSMNIGGGKAMERVLEMTREALKAQQS